MAFEQEGGQPEDFELESFIIGPKEFLPILVYVVIHANLQHLEAYRLILWGLNQQDMLASEKGYYLTVLEEAIDCIKNFCL